MINKERTFIEVDMSFNKDYINIFYFMRVNPWSIAQATMTKINILLRLIEFWLI